MTKMLEQAIRQLRNLPDEVQDLAAAALLEFVSEATTDDERNAVADGRAAYERVEFLMLTNWRNELGLGDN